MTKCPLCNKSAYLGFNKYECPTAGCKNYSKTQADIVIKDQIKEIDEALKSLAAGSGTLKPIIFNPITHITYYPITNVPIDFTITDSTLAPAAPDPDVPDPDVDTAPTARFIMQAPKILFKTSKNITIPNLLETTYKVP